jgi:hypothetical protein
MVRVFGKKSGKPCHQAAPVIAQAGSVGKKPLGFKSDAEAFGGIHYRKLGHPNCFSAG